MRNDITKVFHEPGRVGGLAGKLGDKGSRRMASRLDLEEMPTQERMRRRRRERRENYAPLRRFLVSRVGCLWNDVYSEISATVKVGGKPEKELLEALEWLVATQVTMIDGLPHTTRWGRPLPITGNYTPVWVHPETGLLLRSRPQPKRRHSPRPTCEQVTIDSEHKLVKLDGIWFVVTFEPVPEAVPAGQSPPIDIVLKQPAVRGWRNAAPLFNREWGGEVFAVAKRQASKREIRRHTAS